MRIGTIAWEPERPQPFPCATSIGQVTTDVGERLVERQGAQGGLTGVGIPCAWMHPQLLSTGLVIPGMAAPQLSSTFFLGHLRAVDLCKSPGLIPPVLKLQNYLEGLLKHRFLDSSPRISDSVGPGRDFRMYLSNKLPGDAYALVQTALLHLQNYWLLGNWAPAPPSQLPPQ